MAGEPNEDRSLGWEELHDRGERVSGTSSKPAPRQVVRPWWMDGYWTAHLEGAADLRIYGGKIPTALEVGGRSFRLDMAHHDAQLQAGVTGRDVQLRYVPAATVPAHNQTATPLPVEHETPPSGPQGSGGVSAFRTRRRYGRHVERLTVFAPTRPTAAAFLSALPCGTQRAYVVGKAGGATIRKQRSWATGELPDGWSHAERGHYLSGSSPVLHYVAPWGPVEVHEVAAWLGEGAYSVATAEEAMACVKAALEAARWKMLATPATTGRWALLASLPDYVDADGEGWPELADEHQDLIRSTSGQGRIELLPDRVGAPMPGLCEMDGRLMYSALCADLGAGPATYDELPEWEGFRRGRYLVDVTVPRDWATRCLCRAPGHAGIGLLGEQDPSGGWRYPSEPGETFTTWADGAELHVAYRHGWDCKIRARLLYADRSPTPNPLGAWAAKMVKVRAGIHHPDPEVAELAAGAIRAVILTAIGALHGRPHRLTKVGRYGQVQPSVDTPVTVDGEQLIYGEKSDRRWAGMRHPEWSAGVWAKCRARLLSGPGGVGALHVPANQVVAFRLDAIYLTGRPDWPDDGRVGRFRFRGWASGPLPWPSTEPELLTIRER